MYIFILLCISVCTFLAFVVKYYCSFIRTHCMHSMFVQFYSISFVLSCSIFLTLVLHEKHDSFLYMASTLIEIKFIYTLYQNYVAIMTYFSIHSLHCLCADVAMLSIKGGYICLPLIYNQLVNERSMNACE